MRVQAPNEVTATPQIGNADVTNDATPLLELLKHDFWWEAVVGLSRLLGCQDAQGSGSGVLPGLPGLNRST